MHLGLDARSCNRKWSLNAFYEFLQQHLGELIKIYFRAIPTSYGQCRVQQLYSFQFQMTLLDIFKEASSNYHFFPISQNYSHSHHDGLCCYWSEILCRSTGAQKCWSMNGLIVMFSNVLYTIVPGPLSISAIIRLFGVRSVSLGQMMPLSGETFLYSLANAQETYWLPRFIIHSSKGTSNDPKLQTDEPIWMNGSSPWEKLVG